MWGFEAAAVAGTQCAIHVFDCTVRATNAPPDSLKGRVTFHHLCVANETHTDEAGRRFVSWRPLLRAAGLAEGQAPAYVKMDVEGFEYSVMRHVLKSGPDALPVQLAIELHWRTYVAGARALEPWACRPSPTGKDAFYACEVPPAALARWMDELWRVGGYHLLDRHDNSRSRYCTEVVFARVAAPLRWHGAVAKV